MTSKTSDVKTDKTLDESAIELATLLTEVFHSAKRRSGAPAPELQEAAERGELGPRHAPVVFAVALDNGLSVSQVAERVGLSLATTSLLVGELSRAGILTRSEDERDRRRTMVTVSENYEEWVRAWVGQVVEPMRRALERLSPRARADFLRGFRILSEESARFVAEAEDPAEV
jgi:DNA-binding MarR family transcriptional regulator